MKKAPLRVLLKTAGHWAKDKSPHILVALGITGMIGTVVAAVKATPKAKELVEEAEAEKGEKLTPIEKVKATWKCWLAPAIAFILSVACIVGASAENVKRNAALATACSVSETALRTYQQNVVEALGEEKEKIVRKKTAEEVAEQKQIPQENVYILGGQKMKCVDSLGNEFEADPNDIRKAVNELNKRMTEGEDYISLFDFYYEIGAEQSRVSNDMGWNQSREGLIDVYFTSDYSSRKGLRLVVNYSKFPNYDFQDC